MQPDLKEIVEQYGVMVSSIAHRMIQNKEIAKEAAQEVWYEIIKSIDSLTGNPGYRHGYIQYANAPYCDMPGTKE